jgi:hypothetical protein
MTDELRIDPVVAWKRTRVVAVVDRFGIPMGAEFRGLAGHGSFGTRARFVCCCEKWDDDDNEDACDNPDCCPHVDHAVPTMGNECGFYAWKHGVRSFEAHNLSRSPRPQLDVELSGVIVEHQYGYRAECQVVRRLTFDQSRCFKRPCDAEPMRFGTERGRAYELGWLCEDHIGLAIDSAWLNECFPDIEIVHRMPVSLLRPPGYRQPKPSFDAWINTVMSRMAYGGVPRQPDIFDQLAAQMISAGPSTSSWARQNAQRMGLIILDDPAVVKLAPKPKEPPPITPQEEAVLDAIDRSRLPGAARRVARELGLPKRRPR